MKAAGGRTNPVFKSMNRPLTILGAERRLFFAALVSGAGVFTLMHSLAGAIGLFSVGFLAARRATQYDVEVLRVLLNSGRFRKRYDPMKWEPTEIRIRRTHGQS